MQKTKGLERLILKLMRVGLLPVILVMTFTGVTYAESAGGQEIMDKKISLSVDQAEIKSVLGKISEQADVKFVYSAQKIPCRQKVSFSVKDEKLGNVLNKILAPYGVHYEVAGNKIILRKTEQITTGEAPGGQTYLIEEIPVFPKKIIKGKITDDNGQAIAGVSIKVKGTESGTYSNENGEFFLEVPDNAVLEISYVGFQGREIEVKQDTNLTIQLKRTNNELQDVVVVGYGKQKKISVVGAQSTVKVEELKQPVRSLANNLAGRLAGVIAVQRSGEPGYDDAQFWIRGISTITGGAGSRALVLVDGVERNISNIDPEDVQSFSILKDAAATAVYGVRGANGVVLITTKTGKAGKAQINFDYNEGRVTFTRLPELADGVTYMKLANEAQVNRGRTPIYAQDRIDKTASNEDPYLYPNVDWLDQIFKKWGGNRKASLSITGGAPNANYYISAGYYNERGLFKSDELAKYKNAISLTRYTFTSNFNLKASKTTDIELGISGYIMDGNQPGPAPTDGSGGSAGNIYFYVMGQTPVLHAVKYPDRLASLDYGAMENPYNRLTQMGYRTDFRNELRSNIRVKQDLSFWVKGLNIQGLFSFDAFNQHFISRTKYPVTWLATGKDANGNYTYTPTDKNNGSEFLGYNRSNGGNRKFYTEASLNYERSFGQHNIGGLLLFNQSDYVNGFANDLISSIPFRSRGLAGRATYGYDDRYFIEGNFGYNGSENFDPKTRYGFFPSAAIGWVVSNEKFYGGANRFVQYLKFRGSYGQAGNSLIDPNNARRFGFIATVGSGSGGYNFGQNLDQSFGGNEIAEYAYPVTWETATKTDIGIELRALNNKLNIQADWFNEDRDGGFIRRQAVPAFAGIALLPYGNLAKTNNRGWDGTIEYNDRFGELAVGFRGNFTYTKNKVIENDAAPQPYPWLERRGHKIGQRFGYVALGLFADSSDISKSPIHTGDVRPGDIKFKDLDGDGQIDGDDQRAIGYGSIPEIVYGFGVSLGYKGFDISTFFQGISHVDISLASEGFIPFQQGFSRGNMFSNVTDRWTVDNPNPNANYPRLAPLASMNNNYTTSTWWIRDGSYLRMKSAEIGYTLPKRWVNKAGMKSARIYLLGYNLLTFSPFKLWDVELGDGNGGRYPNTATYSAGINIKF